MIAPEGYVSWDDLQNAVWDWAKVIEESSQYELPRDAAKEELTRGLLHNFLIANYLASFEPLLCSLDGRIFHAPSALWLHADRLDSCPMPRFSGSVAPFDLFYERNRKGDFFVEDIGARFCAIDPYSGTVRVKNNTQDLFVAAWLEGRALDAACLAASELQGLSLCWSPDNLPDTDYEILDTLGLNAFFPLPAETEIVDEQEGKRRRGRPSEAPEILTAYDEIFPNGHRAEGISWKVVTHQVSEQLGRRMKVDTVARTINRRPNRDKEEMR